MKTLPPKLKALYLAHKIPMTAKQVAEWEKAESGEAGKWVPGKGDDYYFIDFSAAKVEFVVERSMYTEHEFDYARIGALITFRTEPEAQAEADRRNFQDRWQRAGDLPPDAKNGYQGRINHKENRIDVCKYGDASDGRNKFSTEKIFLSFVESEGGETEFIRKASGR